MNERIEELRGQALRWAGENVNRNLYSDYEIHLKEYEKFAELIVRECINSLGSQTDQSNLRRKFGIAEPTVEGIGSYYPPPDIRSAESQYNCPAKFEKMTEFKNERTN